MKYAIGTRRAPRPLGHYSQGTTAGRLVFTAGQLGIDPETGEMVPGGLEEQLERAITNCEAILAEAGCDLTDVAKTTVYLVDIADLEAANRVYARRFPAPEPSRTVVQAAALPAGALVELECVACR